MIDSFKLVVFKLFNQLFEYTKGVTLFIIIGDKHPFFLHCLDPENVSWLYLCVTRKRRDVRRFISSISGQYRE